MDYTKEVVDSIKPILKDYGFKIKGLNWLYENEIIVKIFNIQKSQYSRKIYLNIGIKIKAIESNISYSHAGSHIDGRIDHLLSNEILDFESNVESKTRCEEMIKLLKSNPYEFFTLSGDITSLKKLINDGVTIHGVSLKGKKYLGIPT